MILVWVDYLPRYKWICSSKRICHMRIDDLSTYGICGMIFIGRPTKRLVMDLSGPETSGSETFCPRNARPQNVRPWNVQISLTISTTKEKKLLILLPYLSACPIAAPLAMQFTLQTCRWLWLKDWLVEFYSHAIIRVAVKLESRRF